MRRVCSQCLFTVFVRLPVILPCDSLSCQKEIPYLFVSTKLTRNTFLLAGPRESAKGAGKGAGKALERDRTVAGTALHHLKTTHACASVGLRSPSTPSTVDGRNIQTLSTTWTPSTPKLNVRGLARMFRRMDETNQTLETQIQ